MQEVNLYNSVVYARICRAYVKYILSYQAHPARRNMNKVSTENAAIGNSQN